VHLIVFRGIPLSSLIRELARRTENFTPNQVTTTVGYVSQNDCKTIMSSNLDRQHHLPARSTRWTSSATRPEPIDPQNARRNYERYTALARAEAQIGNTVGAENYYQYAEQAFR
jgi:hypothetical protein